MPPNPNPVNPGIPNPPPPPYTETDILSTSGRSAGTAARSHRAASHSSSTHTTSDDNNPIFTPPETPATTYHPSFAPPPPSESAASSGAQAYFESRPAPLGVGVDPQEGIIHRVVVSRESRREDFPYEEGWAGRDVRGEDWGSFVNYLVGHHQPRGTNAGIDEKHPDGLDAGERDDRSQTMGRDGGDGEERVDEEKKEAEWRRHVTSTVEEWNEGFFAPRGITIFLTLQPSPAAHGADARWEGTTPAGRGPSANMGGNDNSNTGRGQFSFGPIRIDGDRVSIGDALHVDRNGVRVGGSDGGPRRGFFGRFGGADAAGNRGPDQSWGPFGGRGGGPFVGRGGGPFVGRGGGPFGGRGGGPFGRGRDEEGHGCEGRGGRGRSRGRHHGGRGRDRSSSTSSSSSSSSSSGSEASFESVGSLPAYEDLRDSQLPVTREYLQQWLEHTEQPITKDSVKALKAQIKKVKSNSPPAYAGPSSSTAPQFDAAALRKEIKGMMAQWKTLKKNQRKAARQAKKERRKARREAKRERREAKRERREGKRAEKKERREARRQGRREGRHGRRGDDGEEGGHGRHGHGHGHGHDFGPGPSASFGPRGIFGPGPVPPPVVHGMHGMPGVPGVPGMSGMPPPPTTAGISHPPVHPVFGGPSIPRDPRLGGIFGRGGFFDRFGGEGYSPRGGPPAYHPPGQGPFHPPPGAWPSEPQGQEAGVESVAAVETTGSHQASSRKYQAAEELAREIERKEKELWALHEALAEEDDEGRGDEKKVSEKGRKAREVEGDIEHLGVKLEKLRMEADAEFARELAEEEVRGA